MIKSGINRHRNGKGANIGGSTNYSRFTDKKKLLVAVMAVEIMTQVARLKALVRTS